MHNSFAGFAVLVILSPIWSIDACVAQEAKVDPLKADATNAPAANQAPVANPQAAVPAGAAIPANRLAPAMLRNSMSKSGLPFDLSNLVLAKFDDSPKGPQLVALVEQTRTEQKEVAVTTTLTEVRTRKVKVGPEGNQQEVEQQYTVAIPVTRNVTRDVQVPVGKKPTAFPLDTLRVYRLDGTRVTEAELREQLEKMSPVFLLRGHNGDIKAVEGVYLHALNPKCLIVVSEKAD